MTIPEHLREWAELYERSSRVKAKIKEMTGPLPVSSPQRGLVFMDISKFEGSTMTKTIQHPDGRTGVEIEGENGSKLIFEPKPKEALARRAAACSGWRWMPGMMNAKSGERAVARYDDGTAYEGGGWLLGERDYPDLDDPATLGCLLALVREAWRDPGLTTMFRHGLRNAWCCRSTANGWNDDAIGATEAEALVAALEAAGERAR